MKCFVWLAANVPQRGATLFDLNVRQAIHSISTAWTTLLFSTITFLGSQAVVIGISACAALAWLVKRRRDWALLIVTVMGGAEVWLSLLKNHFQRQRPEPFFDTYLPPSYSFPSGHALLSFCCYGVLCALASTRLQGAARWLVGICGAALVLAIGVSRIYLGVHYPTDVIGGYLTALAWTAVVAAIYAWFGIVET
jgi:undecaprenyl-diphosphatase